MALCTTPGCVLAAAELIRDMSPDYAEINPCEDFRRFTCEGFDKIHGLRTDQPNLNTITIMSETAQDVLRQVLESPSADMLTGSSSLEQDNLGKIQSAYAACMNETAIQQLGNEPLFEVLSSLEDINQNHGPNITAYVDYLMSFGQSALIKLGVTIDPYNPDQQVVLLTGPGLGLDAKAFYKDERMVALYKETITAVFTRLNQTEEASICPQSKLCGQLASFAKPSAVQALVELESKIAAATPDAEQSQDPTLYYSPLNITDVEDMLPQISVSSLITKKAPDYLPRAIIVESPAFLRSLSGTLEGTPDDIVQFYMYWKLILGLEGVLESDAIEPVREFNSILEGKDATARPERWRTCVADVDTGLSWLLSSYYVKETFSEKSKEFGDRIILDIKDQYVKKIQGSEWMSEDVRKSAIDKVHSIRQKIGYPTKSPNIKDPQQLQDYYSDVNITNGYLANSLSMVRSLLARKWSRAGKPTDRDTWQQMTAATVKAYYSPPLGEIGFSAAIMQRPEFYDPSIPQYLSYGAFGFIAGHELSHAFDSNGRHYDAQGRFRDWWDNKTVEAFQEKANCFVSEYGNFTVPNPDNGLAPIHVNGKLTLNENIADAGGLSVSFQAWKRREQETTSLLLPGFLNFTKEQVFFLSYAHSWCDISRPKFLGWSIYNDEHSPNNLRIQGTMENSREFREAFNCPVKEPTCALW